MALEKNELSITAFSILVAAALGTFSCKRPTTPCDQLYGECNLQSGQCMCSSGGIGLQCSVSGGTVNSGACHIMNPCLNGATCYDNGVGSSCSCPDGFYGDRCQHPMVYWKCYPDKMEVNIFPYGYDVHGWNSGKPGTGKDNSCKLETIPTVRTQGLNYVLPAWDGFAGQFKHLNDSCAGNATVEWDNSTGTMYSRRIYVSYSATYFHETDQDIVVKCEVIKPQQTLPTKRPNAVNYYITDQHGWPVESPVKLGSRINVTFHVDPLSGFVDLKILDCLVLDVGSTTPVVVVTNSCPEPPIGLALTKPSGGMHVLTLTMYKFPGFANDLHFQCRARVCLAADKTCNTPPGCQTRIKRSVRSAAAAWSPSDNILIIDSRSVK